MGDSKEKISLQDKLSYNESEKSAALLTSSRRDSYQENTLLVR